MPDYEKIHNNLLRMVEQKAPKEHLDLYLKHQGVTGKQVGDWYNGRQEPPQEPSINKPQVMLQNNSEDGESWQPSQQQAESTPPVNNYTPIGDGSVLTEDRATKTRREFAQTPGYLKPLVTVYDVANLGVQGLTGGILNAASAGIVAPFSDKTYSELLAIRNANVQASRDRAGSAGLATELGGGVAGAGKLMKAGVTFTRFAPSAVAAGGKVANTTKAAKVARVLANAGDGVVLNEAVNIGAGNELGENALLAGGLGAGLPLVAGGIKGALNSVGKTKFGRSISGISTTPKDIAAQKIYNLAQKLDPALLKKQSRRLGAEGLALDLLGTQGTALARNAANISTRARGTLENALQGRSYGQNDRVVSDINRAARLPINNTKTVDDLKKEAYAKVAPSITKAYDEAKAAGYDLSLEQFKDIFSTPMGKEAYKKGLKNTQNLNFKNVSKFNSFKDIVKTVVDEDKKMRDGYRQAVRVSNSLAPSIPKKEKNLSDLFDTIRSFGGINDPMGELSRFDLPRGIVNKNKKIVPGKGWNIDEARSLAIQNGFLPDGYTSMNHAIDKSTPSDFIELLLERARGNKIYSVFENPEAVARDSLRGETIAQKNTLKSDAKRINGYLNEEGLPPIDDDVFKKAIENYTGKEMPIDEAVRAAGYDDYIANGMPPPEPYERNVGEQVRKYSNLELLDNIKKAFDDMAGSAFVQGKKSQGAVASAMAKALREQTDTALLSDVYAKARGARQNAHRTDEAFDAGRVLAGNRVPLDAPQKAKTIEDSKKRYLAQGYAAQQAENLLNKGDTIGALNKMRTAQGSEAIKAALGKRGALVSNALARERRFNSSATEALGGSTTARQLYEMGESQGGGFNQIIPPIGNTLSFLRGAANIASKKLASKKSRELAPYIAELLTGSSLPSRQPIPDSFLQKLAKGHKEEDLKKILFNLLMSSQRGEQQEQ